MALIGKYLKRINLNALVDLVFPVQSKFGGIANSDILKSYLGLLCLGKNDFDAIEGQRKDRFLARALGVHTVPSSPTLRQRLDTHASSWFELVDCINARVLGMKIEGRCIDFGVLLCGYVPLDVDTFAIDNSGTAPLLFRADSGFDSAKLMCAIGRHSQVLQREVAFIIKWNPRSTPVKTWAQARVADAATRWTVLREGKRQCVWSQAVEITHAGQSLYARRVFRLTERTIDKRGQQLLLPEYVFEGWSTTLPQRFDEQAIIKLYADHGTHEQFHSEFKTDMNLTRLPSGKFDTNYLVCALAAVAMNLLRLVGQHTLHESDSPVRHSAQRRRIRTVMQELIFKAGRLVHHARQ